MKSFRVAVVAGLTLIASAVRSETVPTSTVLLWCEATLDDPIRIGRCHGALASMAIAGRSLPEWQCVPRAVLGDTEQLRRLFVREGQRLPEVLHLPPERLLFYAVAKAFPCPLRSR